MTTHFDIALQLYRQIQQNVIQCGREAKLAIALEGKTIRDFSFALCGNASLEDRIGRWIMAAEFHDSLPSVSYGNIKEHLSPGHYTELQKIENVTDRANALDVLQDVVTRNPDHTINVKPVEWLRAQRGGAGKTYVDKLHSYYDRIDRDLIVTPFDGLTTREQMEAAAGVRENALRLKESIELLFKLLNAELESV